MRRLFAAFPALFALAGFSGAAHAHAHLMSAVPAADAAVSAAPGELDLHFSEGVNLAFTGAGVAGPGNAAVKTGEASLKPGDDTTLIVPIAETLPPGTYSVSWHALSADGHKTTGSYHFTVK